MKPATLQGFVHLNYQRSCELAVIQQLMEAEYLNEEVRAWIASVIGEVRRGEFDKAAPEGAKP